MSQDVLFYAFFSETKLEQPFHIWYNTNYHIHDTLLIGGDLLRICDFTINEIMDIKSKANFTKQENLLFDCRNNEHSLEVCAEIMNCSVATVYRINKRMINKIKKVM